MASNTLLTIGRLQGNCSCISRATSPLPVASRASGSPNLPRLAPRSAPPSRSAKSPSTACSLALRLPRRTTLKSTSPSSSISKSMWMWSSPASRRRSAWMIGRGVSADQPPHAWRQRSTRTASPATPRWPMRRRPPPRQPRSFTGTTWRTPSSCRKVARRTATTACASSRWSRPPWSTPTAGLFQS